MGMAAILCVREDREQAERLLSLLRRVGFSFDGCATAYERPAEYEAAVALFSPAAVKSSLLLWASKQALDSHRLVPVYLVLTALPRAFEGTPIHDLTDWHGEEEEHPGVLAVQRHLQRLGRVRSDEAALAQVGRGARSEPAASRPAASLPPADAARPAPPQVAAAQPTQSPAPAAARPRFVFRENLDFSEAREATRRFRDTVADGAGQALEPNAHAAPTVSAAARRRRLILRERLQSGLPIS